MSAQRKMQESDFEFDADRPVGTGAFSKVVVGLYKPTTTRYAVKIISKESILSASSDEERLKMAEVARRETRMLLMCQHPGIVKFIAAMQTPKDLLYVTELCEGGELQNAIIRRGKIPLEASRHVIAELFSAVFYLHSGEKRKTAQQNSDKTIIHRDIKPENIMLSADMHVRLIDFGTAVACDSIMDCPEDENKSSSGSGGGRAQTFCGTTYYMSPELLEHSYTCCASDLWGCGCVLYHMLTGQRPFDGATPYVLIRSILDNEPKYPRDMDPEAADLISKLLIKNPQKRIQPQEIKKHPFFASIQFSDLFNQNVRELWLRETPWVDPTSTKSCATCTRSHKDYCRFCGKYFCGSCLNTKRVIPESRYGDSEVFVCATCADSPAFQKLCS